MAVDEEDLDASEEEEVSPAKSGVGLKNIILFAAIAMLMSAVGAGATYFLLSGKDNPVGDEVVEPEKNGVAKTAPKKPNAKKQTATPKEPAIYSQLSPPFVVTFQSQGQLRYMQINLSAMARDQKTIDQVEHDMPAIRDAIIQTLSGQDFETLSSVEGKEKMRKDLLQATRRIVNDGKKLEHDVEAIFITGLVMQ